MLQPRQHFPLTARRCRRKFRPKVFVSFGCRRAGSKRKLRSTLQSAWRSRPELTLRGQKDHHGRAGRHSAGASGKAGRGRKPDCLPRFGPGCINHWYRIYDRWRDSANSLGADRGASIAELRIRDGKRESVFGSYVRPLMSRPNLTVLTDALVTRLIFDGKRVLVSRFLSMVSDVSSRRVARRCCRLARSTRRKS